MRRRPAGGRLGSQEALQWCRKAYTLRPDVPNYAYTCAFYLNQAGSQDEGIKILSDMVRQQVPHADAYGLLASIHMRRGEFDKARKVYEAAAKTGDSRKRRGKASKPWRRSFDKPAQGCEYVRTASMG